MQYLQIITEERKRQGITQAMLADALQTTQQMVNRYEQGQTELPLRRFLTIADILGVSLDYLAGRTDCREVNHENTDPQKD